MPIYEYTCPACHSTWDDLKPMGTEEAPCPYCVGVGRKSKGSYLSAVHGLENGHIAVGSKLTGKEANKRG